MLIKRRSKTRTEDVSVETCGKAKAIVIVANFFGELMIPCTSNGEEAQMGQPGSGGECSREKWCERGRKVLRGDSINQDSEVSRPLIMRENTITQLEGGNSKKEALRRRRDKRLKHRKNEKKFRFRI